MAKRALLVGINKYRVPGNDLRGCVNDVRDMQDALVRFHGFARGDITVLTDRAASTKAMRTKISALVARGKKGDVLLFHYSGHGSNVPDQDGDEADHRDEILCPADLDWKDPLTDDWLRKTFDGLKKGVNLTVIMDCCHSGSNTREFHLPDSPSIPRYLASPWDLVASESGRKLTGKVRGGLRRSPRAKRRKNDVIAANLTEVLLTGCRDTQTSADADFGSRYNGALTYYVVAAIKRAEGKLTHRELRAQVRTLLRRDEFSQVPQLEGRKESFDRLFLEPVA